MTRPVDEKLVLMKMDHSDLKKKANETAGILGKLKDSIGKIGGANISNVTKDFSKISKAANSVDLGGLNRSIDAITNRFSNMGVVATTALANIANKATNIATQTAYSLGPAQVVSGFSEYEMKMNSIGTMLANTKWEGKNLEDVKKVLEELNDYSDQTIYSFAEMTRSIGRFTAAGVGLEDSAIAIKGMGNLAALSGANSEQMNRAMYQVSQALAGGYFQKIDWNSVEEASMGGKMTKDALIETAKAMGIFVDESKSFGNSLEDGWLTSEVWINTMRRFGEDQSMVDAATKIKTFSQMMETLREGIGSSWATTFEILFGDFEYATKFWTSVSDLIKPFFEKQGTARNNLLRSVFGEDGKGVYGVLDSFKSITSNISALAGTITGAFDNVFPKSGESVLTGIVDGIAKLGDVTKVSDKTLENLTIIFTGMFSVLELVGIGIMYVVDAFANLIPGIKAVGGGILNFIASIFTIPIMMVSAAESTDALSGSASGLGKVMQIVSSGLSKLGDFVGNFGYAVIQAFKILSSGSFKDGPIGETSFVVDSLMAIRSAFIFLAEKASNFSISETFSNIVDAVRNIPENFNNAKEAISEFFTNVWNGFANNQGWILAGGSFAGIVAIGWKIWEIIDAFTKPLSGFGEVLEQAGASLQAFAIGIHVRSLLTIAVAVGILAASFLLLSNLNTQQITNGLYMIIGSLTAMVVALTVMSKFDITGNFGATLQIMAMATALGIMAISVKLLADLDVGQITKGLVSVISLLAGLSGAMVLMTRFGGKTLAVGALQFLAMAGAVLILVTAVDKLIGIDEGALTRGLLALGAVMASMGLLVAMSSKSKFGASSGVGLLAVALAVKMMTDSIETMGSSIADGKPILEGLALVSALMLGLGLVAKVANQPGVLMAGASMLLIAGAINALMIPLTALGSLPIEVLVQGMVSIGVALAGLVLATTYAASAIPGAIAITIIAAALNLLIVPITALGMLPLEVVGIGLLAIVGAILAIAGASSIAAPAAGAILAIAGALSLLSAGIGIAGWGLGLLAKGLAIFAGIAVGLATAIVAALGVIINGLIALSPAFTDLIMKAIDGIIRAVEYSAPKVINAFGDLIITISNTIGERSPEVVKAVVDMIIKVLDGLEQNIPRVIEKFSSMVISILNSLEDNIPPMITAGADYIVAFLEGISTEIPRVIDSMQQFAIDVINGLADGLEQNGGALVDATTRLLGEVLILMLDIGAQMVTSIFGWIPGVAEAMASVTSGAEESIRTNFNAAATADELGNEFASGLSGTSDASNGAGSDLANSGKSGASSVSLNATGAQFGQGFANGIGSGSVLSSVWNAAKGLASRALNAVQERLDINSPSREAYILGDFFGDGLSGGISSTKGKVSKSAEEIAEAALSSLNSAISETDEQYDLGLLNYNEYIYQLSRISNASSKYQKTQIIADRKLREAQLKHSKEWIDNELYYKRLSLEDELKAWERVQARYAKGTQERIEADKEVFRLKNELVVKGFNHSKEWIDNEKYYKRLSLEDELAAWERVQARYAKGTDERIEADKEVYRLKNELVKDSFDYSKKWIDTEKSYNRLSLKDELDAWERVQARYDKGTDERIEADKEVYRLKNDINQKINSINEDFVKKSNDLNTKLIEDIKRVTQEYQNQEDELTKSLTGFANIFDEINNESKKDITGSKLLDNLRGQVETFANWSNNINILSAKNIDPELMKTLREMGPAAAVEIAALNSLAESELIEYSNLWKTKNAMARDEAKVQLTDQRADTEKQIQQMTNETASQLDVYKEEWNNALSEIKNGVKDQYVDLNDDMSDVGGNAITKLIEGMKGMIPELKNQSSEIAKAISSTISEVLNISPDKLSNLTNGLRDDLKVENPVESLTSFVSGYNNPVNTNLIPLDNSGLNTLQYLTQPPDTSYTSQTLSGVETRNRNNSSGSQNGGNKGEYREGDIVKFTEAVNSISNRPIQTQVYLEGTQIAEVVSQQQHNDAMITAMSRGVSL